MGLYSLADIISNTFGRNTNEIAAQQRGGVGWGCVCVSCSSTVWNIEVTQLEACASEDKHKKEGPDIIVQVLCDEKIGKLLDTIRNINPNIDTTTFTNELDKLTKFRDKGSEQKKIEYFDENQYALYEGFFYTMLIIISILFIRSQIRK